MQPAPSPGVDKLEELHKQAAQLSKLPVVAKLLADPGAVERVSAKSPQLAQILASNPVMKDMLQPQAVSQLLHAAQDPQSLSDLLGAYCVSFGIRLVCISLVLALSCAARSHVCAQEAHLPLRAAARQQSAECACSRAAGHARRLGKAGRQQTCSDTDASPLTELGAAPHICHGDH